MHTTLISAHTLLAHVNDPDWIVFDLRHELANPEAGRSAHASAHIPGALFLHMDDDLVPVRGGVSIRVQAAAVSVLVPAPSIAR